MQNDLISRKPLIDMLQGVEDNIFAEATRDFNPAKAFIAGVLQEVKNQVIALPGVDAVQVVHERWQNRSCGYANCSRCGWEHPEKDERGYYVANAYCPECGAKMDAKEDAHG